MRVVRIFIFKTFRPKGWLIPMTETAFLFSLGNPLGTSTERKHTRNLITWFKEDREHYQSANDSAESLRTKSCLPTFNLVFKAPEQKKTNKQQKETSTNILARKPWQRDMWTPIQSIGTHRQRSKHIWGKMMFIPWTTNSMKFSQKLLGAASKSFLFK